MVWQSALGMLELRSVISTAIERGIVLNSGISYLKVPHKEEYRFECILTSPRVCHLRLGNPVRFGG